MKERQHNNISILVPVSEKTQVPPLGYESIKGVLSQAFPDMNVDPVYIDNPSSLERADILIANFYSTLGFIDLFRTLRNSGYSLDKKQNPFITIAGGTGAYNPLPVKDTVDYVTFTEGDLVGLLSQKTGVEARAWSPPNPVWARTDYITSIMPTESCKYKCTFCQLRLQNDGRVKNYDLEEIRRIIAREEPRRILVHSASILQYEYLDELVDVLDKSEAEIYLGSMNLIDIDQKRSDDLFKLKPRHTIGAEKDTDVQLYFGLETGSARVLSEMRKPLTRKAAVEKVDILKASGFRNLGFYLILGYPNTATEDSVETIDLVNSIADTVGDDGKISIKCTPFIPHLGTGVSHEPARYWADCVQELNLLRRSVRPNIGFDISDPLYYLTSIVLIRGNREHASLLQHIVRQRDFDIKDDNTMDSLLAKLELPSLEAHLKGKAPLDLSRSRRKVFDTNEI
ncbi:radical SAM protein [Candidatus Daviesbacteria bacterium]|nr:radical SAM protein [Candidatus Daviesbacteria bacterium]